MVLNKSFLAYSLVSAFFVFGTGGAFAQMPMPPGPTPTPTPAPTISPMPMQSPTDSPTPTDSPMPTGYCGDGIIQAPETCDDHNNYWGDGCSGD